jgi:hypothetical protein
VAFSAGARWQLRGGELEEGVVFEDARNWRTEKGSVSDINASVALLFQPPLWSCFLRLLLGMVVRCLRCILCLSHLSDVISHASVLALHYSSTIEE